MRSAHIAVAVVIVTSSGCLEVGDRLGDDIAVPFSVDPSGGLAGLVRAEGGAPLANAWISLTPRAFEASTGPDGAFRLGRVPPGDYTLHASAAGHRPVTLAVSVSDGADTEVDVTLSPAVTLDGSLRVRVFGPDLAPLVDAVVLVDDVETLTDPDGYATVYGLGGRTVAVEVTSDDDETWPRTAAIDVPARGAAHLEVTLSGRAADRADYVGDDVCAFCHEDLAASHAGTRHDRALVVGGAAPAWLDGRTVPLPAGASIRLGPGLSAVLTDSANAQRSYTIAGFVGDPSHGTVPYTTTSSGAQPLPVAWVAGDPRRTGSPDGVARLDAFEASRWFDGAGRFVTLSAPHAAEAQCFGCHVTGFEADVADDGSVVLTGENGAWTDPGVTCERCHGPGSEHRSAALSRKAWTITNPAFLDADRRLDVCGQCHSGLSSHDEGLPFPATAARGVFRPGESLADFAAPAPVEWSAGFARGPHQQRDELGASAHGGLLGCADCHDPHSAAVAEPQLRVTVNDNALCLTCHLGRTFGSLRAARAHTGHNAQAPEGLTESGRCVGCHMPRTASDAGFSDFSGSGTLSSHRFAVLRPSETLAAFDEPVVLPGEFPQHSCADCHSYNGAIWPVGVDFPGPHGDPSLRATHQAYDAGFLGMFGVTP
jgi:predicted CXXCH cytochrome family protein